MRGTATGRSVAAKAEGEPGSKRHAAWITAAALVLSTIGVVAGGVMANADPGDIDSSWGLNGISVLHTAAGSSDEILAEVIDSSGKLVVAGQTVPSGGVQKAFIARLTSTGALDPTFGNQGVTVTQFGNSGGDSIRGLVLQGSNILAVGQRNDSVVLSGVTHIHTAMAVARYNSVGALDASFATNGVATIDVGDHADFGQAIALDPATGKIVAVGSDKIGWLIARLTANGALDTSFDAGGHTIPAGFTTPAGTVELDWTNDPSNPQCAGPDNGMTVGVQSNSMIVAGGYDQGTCTSTTGDFGIARILADGSGLDSGFGTSGRSTADFGGFDFPFAGLMEGNGSTGTTFLMVGRGGSGVDFALARFTLSGALDGSFSTDGKVLTDLGSSNDQARAIAEQSDGRYVVAGFTLSGSTDDFAVARYNRDGSLDSANFHGTGKLATNLQGSGSTASADDGMAIAIEPGTLGKIIVGGSSLPHGSSLNGMATVRYFAAYPPQVTTQPSSTTVCTGQDAVFTAAAGDTRNSPAPPITVQWQQSTNGGTTWSDIANATSTTLTVASTTTSMDGYKYRAAFTNSGGTVFTNAATLTVNFPPAVTQNPTSVSAYTNEQVSFSATASGKPTPTIQWQSAPSGSNTFSNISAATSSPYQFTPASTSAGLALNGSQYRAVFQNSCSPDATTTAATLTETQPATDTALSSSANPSAFGQPVTFTATVTKTVGAPGHVPPGTPSGTVSFYLDGSSTAFDSEALVWGSTSGTATSTAVSNLDVGGSPHTVTATYSGDAVFLGSNGTLAGGQQVVKDATTTALSPTAPTTVYGQTQQFSATVTSNPPGAGTPTGTVTLNVDGTPSQTGSLTSGSTSVTNPAVPAGTHSVVAHYNGDSNFASSDSAAGTWTVNKATTTTDLASDLNPADAGTPVTFTATVAVVAPGSGTPTGSVLFHDGATLLGSGTLDTLNETASYTTSSLAPGTHSITASYSSDGNFSTSTSSAVSQVINPIPTTTVVTTSDAGAVSGEPLTFTATVTPGRGTGTPTGTVQFSVDGTPVGSAATLSGGEASISGVVLTAAGSPHIIGATYSGDSVYSSSSGSYSQAVSMDTTTTTVQSSVNPSVYGQAVTFTATVAPDAPGSGAPTGTVTFYVDGAQLGSPVAVSAGHATSAAVSTLSVGGHSVEADYSGDANYDASTGNVTQDVNQAASATSVASSVNPSVVGQAVTFTATVSAVTPGAGTPTGTVQFVVDGSNFGSPATLSAGQATSGADSALSVGSHHVSAVYSGDTNFNSSTASTITQVVNQASTATSLAATPTSSVFGQTVHLTATVTVSSPGAGTPTGTVTFLADGSTALGSAPVAADGTATLDVSTLSAGAHTITATYGGDASFVGSTSSGTSYTVSADSTTTSVTSAANPSVYGQPVTFTATVAADAPGGGTPTGTVTFSIDGTAFAAVHLSGGAASATMSTEPPGTYSIVVTYSPDTADFQGSTSPALTQTVEKANTSTVLTSSSNPSTVGQAVTITATAGVQAPGNGQPTGSVTFTVDGGSPTTVPMSSGAADLTTQFATAGDHTVVATYSGDANFNGSSQTLVQQVNKADSSVAVQSTPNPSVFGQQVTYTAHVAPVGGASGTPTGTVQFIADTGPLGSPVALDSSGTASIQDSSLPSGNHSVSAVYGGDANFNGSTAPAISQTVQRSSTGTVLTSSVPSSVYGQVVTFQATVTASAPGAGTPTGSVTFLDNGSSMGSAPLDSSGSAILVSSTLAVGTHSITAAYGGDGNFNGSTSNAVNQQVSRANTSTTISSSGNPSVYAQPVTFTATVAAVAPGGGIPDGELQWYIDGAAQGGPAPLDGTGRTTLTTSTLTAGHHVIDAVYNYPGSNYQPSRGSLTQTVQDAVTTTTVSSSANPSLTGQSVTFTAHVTGDGTPTGSVQFLVDGAAFGSPVPLDSSTGLATSGSISTLSVGGHTIEADYGGDPNHFSSSGTLRQTVQKASTATQLVSSPNPSIFGQPVTFTATVAAVAPGTGTPTGTVDFQVNGRAWATATLSGGSATWTTGALPPSNFGPINVTAVYSGDGAFNGSTSNTVTQAVQFTSNCLTSVKNGLVVNSGQALCVSGTTTKPASVKGGITVRPGGALFLSFATVQGGIVSNGATDFRMCHSSSGSGSVTVTGSTGPVVIGDNADDGSPACGSDSISGGLTVSGNTGGVEIGSSSISGGLVVTSNSGGTPPDSTTTEIEGNTISGGLSCSGNTPAPTDDGAPNTVTSGGRSGQCATPSNF